MYNKKTISIIFVFLFVPTNLLGPILADLSLTES